MKHIKLAKWIAATILAGAISVPQVIAVERTGSHSVRASTLKGAAITFQEGGTAGRVEDVILDPETGCARFAVIQLEGGKTIAAPYRVLRSSGSSGYVVSVTRDQLLNAPAVDLNRAEEFSTPEFSQQVYGYYKMGPQGEVNIRERDRVKGERESNAVIRGEQGREIRTRQGQEHAAPGAAEAGRSPAPLGERTKKKNHGQASVTPSASVSPSATASPSSNVSPLERPSASPFATSSPATEATPALRETPGSTPATPRTQTPTTPGNTREAAPGTR